MTTSNEPCVVPAPAPLSVLGTSVEVFLDAARTGGQFTAYRCTVPPAGGPPPHRHDFDEAFTVLEGTLEIRCGTEVHLARTGDTVFAPRGTVHTFKNVGDVPAAYFGVATPAGHEGFFEEAGRMTTFDVPTMVALCERHGIELVMG